MKSVAHLPRSMLGFIAPKTAAGRGCSGVQKQQRRCVHVEKRLEALGIVLPAAPLPKANYNIVCRASANMLYVSGHLPIRPDGTVMTGRIGPAGGSSSEDGKSVEYGYEAARYAGLNIVSTLKEQLGDLDRVKQIVKVRYRTCGSVLCFTNRFGKSH